LRIYPIYLLALLVFSVIAYGIRSLLFSATGQKDLLLHIFFLHNLSSKTFFGGGNGVFWSLALEMQLYLIYPLLLILRNKIGMKKCFFSILGLSFFLFLIGMLPPYHLNSLVPYDVSVFKYWFIWCAGALLAESYFNRQKIFTSWGGLIFLIAFLLTFVVKANLYLSYITIYLVTFTIIAFVECF